MLVNKQESSKQANQATNSKSAAPCNLNFHKAAKLTNNHIQPTRKHQMQPQTYNTITILSNRQQSSSKPKTANNKPTIQTNHNSKRKSQRKHQLKHTNQQAHENAIPIKSNQSTITNTKRSTTPSKHKQCSKKRQHTQIATK